MAARDESSNLSPVADQQERLGTSERSRWTDIETWFKSLREQFNTVRAEILTALNASARTPATGEPAHTASISFAAGAANVSAVTVQLKDVDGDDIGHSEHVNVWLSDQADGLSLATAADTIAATTGLVIGTHVAEQSFEAVTDADGALVFDLTDASKDQYYIVAGLATGAIVVSAQMEVADYGS